MSPTTTATAPQATASPALTGRYGAIGIVAVSAALIFTRRPAASRAALTNSDGSPRPRGPLASNLHP